MSQLDLEMHKQELGRNRVEVKHDEWINLARREAVRISARKGYVSTVDLHAWAQATGLHPDSASAYSAVFRGREWVPTGTRVKSTHEGSHGRGVETWRYQSTVY